MPDWQQVTDYIDPARGRFETPAANGGSSRKRSRSKIINNTATECVRVATAGMSSHMTSKARPWFNLSTPDPAMGQMQDVKVWLEDVTTIIRDTLAKSNFYKAMPVCYTEDLSYGVAAMMIVDHPEEVVRFHPLTVGSYAVSLDDAGKVDSLWRCYSKTARQLVQRYGKPDADGVMKPDASKMPDNLVQAFDNNPDMQFTVEAMCEPNPDARPGMGPLGIQAPEYRPYREVVWISGTASAQHGVLDIGGHYEQPFVCIRFNPVGDDVYSACPGTDSLGDIKQLQYLEGQKLRLIDLMAEPPITIPDSMRNLGGMSLAPRSKNYLPQGQNGAKVEATYTPQPGSLQWVMAEIERVENRIRNALFYPLFLMLKDLGDQAGRTATEIAARKEEQATVLGPTLEIVTDEGLDPTVVRVFRLLERQGRIPPPPDVLANIPLKIEYTSILAQAMKASGVSGIERTAAFAAQLAQVAGPEVLDKFDFDQAMDEYSDRTGAPASLIRDDDAVAGIRQARAAQQAQAQMLAAAKPIADGAQAIKTLGDSVPQPGSVGEGLAQQLAGVA